MMSDVAIPFLGKKAVPVLGKRVIPDAIASVQI